MKKFVKFEFSIYDQRLICVTFVVTKGTNKTYKVVHNQCNIL